MGRRLYLHSSYLCITRCTKCRIAICAKLERMVVHRSYQGKGVGSKALDTHIHHLSPRNLYKTYFHIVDNQILADNQSITWIMDASCYHTNFHNKVREHNHHRKLSRISRNMSLSSYFERIPRTSSNAYPHIHSKWMIAYYCRTTYLYDSHG